jgi:hypothetical protein
MESAEPSSGPLGAFIPDETEQLRQVHGRVAGVEHLRITLFSNQ